jgi:membrane protease YdiL (CAAX protease family)
LNARSFFIAADGRAQPPWRILIFVGTWLLCVIVVTQLLNPLLGPADRMTGSVGIPRAIAALLATVLAHALMIIAIDKRTWGYVGLDQGHARPRVLVPAFVVGAAPIAFATLLLLAVGWLRIIPAASGSWIMAAVQVTAVLAPAALTEELLSRGYVFATLREWLGPAVAVALTSIGFGLLHIPNPGSNATSIALVILAGVFLATVLLVTGSLYAAWIAHFAWNWIMAVPFHVPVSGLPLARPGYETVDAGPDLVTGGAWGPEGGLGAAAGMLGALAYLYWRSSRTRHEPIER